MTTLVAWCSFLYKRRRTGNEEYMIISSAPSGASHTLCWEIDLPQKLSFWRIYLYAMQHPHCNPQVTLLAGKTISLGFALARNRRLLDHHAIIENPIREVVYDFLSIQYISRLSVKVISPRYLWHRIIEKHFIQSVLFSSQLSSPHSLYFPSGLHPIPFPQVIPVCRTVTVPSAS